MSPAGDQLGIEHQTVFGLPPVQFAELAADLDCRYIALGLTGGPYNPHGYEPYSLRDDPSLRRRLIATLDDRGVSISLGEGFVVRPGHDIADDEPDLDVMAELGVARINTVSMDPDVDRSLDQFAELAELAGRRGLSTTVEFAPSLTQTSLAAALDAIRFVGRPDFSLLIDTMHLTRCGNTAAEVAALDPALIGYVQLSDNSRAQRGAVYRDDSIDRMAPGDGELPLLDVLTVLPPDVVIGLEVPMRSRAEAGEPTPQRARRCVEGARRLLSELPAR